MPIATTDSLQIIREIIDLKEQIQHIKPDWHQYITPTVSGLAILTSLIIGLMAPKMAYKYNSELEKKKRETLKQKDREDLIRKLYADVVEYQQALHIELDFLNQSAVEANFFYYLSLTETIEENRKSHMQQYDDENKKFNEGMKNATSHHNKFVRAIAEYKKLMPESIIYSFIEDFRTVSYNYESRSYFEKSKRNRVELEKVRDIHINLAREYVSNEVISRSNKIVECIEHDK